MHTYGTLKPCELEVDFKEVEELSLQVLKAEVDGGIECVYNPMPDLLNDRNFIAVCNDEGLILALPPNLESRAGTIHGNIVFCKYDAKSGDLIGLDDKQINFLKSLTNDD